MTQSERERLHQAIDTRPLKKGTANELHYIVDEFLSTDYQGISPQRKLELESRFRIRRLKFLPHISLIEKEAALLVLDDIEKSFFTVLDKSVDLSKSKKGLLERCIEAIKVPLHFSFQVVGNLLSPKVEVPLSKKELKQLPDASDENNEK